MALASSLSYVFTVLLQLVVLLSLFAGTAHSNAINQTCTRNTDCSASNSMCNVPSVTCGGICQCIPGFAYDSVSGNCLRARYLGQPCSQTGDACVGGNMQCTGGGSCSCIFGYKQGLQGTDCVPNLMTQTSGDTCHDSAQCYYSLVCINNKCGCYAGYKSYGKYSCSARQVYESCASNDDCQLAQNSQCANGRCDCMGGYHAIQYQADIATKAYACISSGDSPSGEGGSCNLDPDAGPLLYCQVPFICAQCGGASICTLNKPLFISHASHHQESIVLQMAAVLFVSLTLAVF